jgi:hypothetical protein
MGSTGEALSAGVLAAAIAVAVDELVAGVVPGARSLVIRSATR